MKKAPAAGYSVCFWQRAYGRTLAFSDTEHRIVVGTSENLQQGNLESYWKAVGPTEGEKKRKEKEEERKEKTIIFFRDLRGIK